MITFGQNLLKGVKGVVENVMKTWVLPGVGGIGSGGPSRPKGETTPLLSMLKLKNSTPQALLMHVCHGDKLDMHKCVLQYLNK
jgi:hypothetical protein